MIGASVWYRLFQWLIIFQFFKEILLNNLGPHFQKNTFITHGMQLKIQNAFKVFLSIFNVVLVVPIECYSCGWQSAVESSLFHQVKSNFHFWQVKSNLYFQQVKSNFYFQQVKSIFYFWQVPAKFPLVTSSACLEAVNQAIYSSTHFFVNIPIIILDDVIEAYNLSHFLSISISGIEFGVLNYFPFYFCHFSIITEDIFWSQLITLLFDVFFVVDIDANVGDDADVGVDAYQTWELSKKLHNRIFGQKIVQTKSA